MITRNHPLYHALGKLNRGREHIDALTVLNRESFSQIPIGYRRNIESGEEILYLNIETDFFFNEFQRFGLILGDAIQNLRAALDHLAFALAFTNTRGNIDRPQRIQFPICDHSNNWGREIDRGRLNGVSEIHLTKIEGFQPYDGINGRPTAYGFLQPLKILQRYSNIDKHRHLVEMEIPPMGIYSETAYGGFFQYLIESGILFSQTLQESIRLDTAHFKTEMLRIQTDKFSFETDVDVVARTDPQIIDADGFEIDFAIRFIFVEVRDIISDFADDIS